MYTPWTIDTYSTFTFDREEEYIIDDLCESDGKQYTYDDFTWDYDHKGLVKQLHENWLGLIHANVLDEVILAIEPDGEPWSPKYYNHGTDNANIHFVVDYEKLLAYIDVNREHYEQNKIRSTDGFMWLGDEDETMLQHYLTYKSGADYTDESYECDQWDLLIGNGQMQEFINYEVTKK